MAEFWNPTGSGHEPLDKAAILLYVVYNSWERGLGCGLEKQPNLCARPSSDGRFFWASERGKL